MKTILWLSDGPALTTGYCTISRKLLNYLVNDYGWTAHFLSHTGQQQTFKPGTELEDGEKFNFYVHGSGMARYSADLVMPKIREIKPDIFGVLLDTFMLMEGGFLNLDFAPAKSVMYFPNDGGGGLKDGKLIKGMGCRLPLGCENILRKFDYSVAMAKYAQIQAKEIHGIDSFMIPHAVEPEVYKPLSDQEKLSLKIKYGLDGKFVIGCVARNQGRKMLDRTIYAMKKIAENIPNAVLLLHTDKQDAAAYFNFDALLQELNLQNRVFFTGTKWYKGFDYRQMNEVYNLMDIFLLGTSGEGFGIPIIEAMSCAIPVLVTDYTTTWELVERNKAGEAIKKQGEILGTWNVGRAIMDINDAADKVIKLYNNPLLRKEYGLNGRSAVLREYSWQTVAKQWNDYLLKIVNGQ